MGGRASLRASSPIWASEVSLARTRERGADPFLCPSRLRRSLARSLETRFTRLNRRACSQAKGGLAGFPRPHFFQPGSFYAEWLYVNWAQFNLAGAPLFRDNFSNITNNSYGLKNHLIHNHSTLSTMDNTSRSSVYSFLAPKPSAVQYNLVKLNEENIFIVGFDLLICLVQNPTLEMPGTNCYHSLFKTSLSLGAARRNLIIHKLEYNIRYSQHSLFIDINTLKNC